mgnify:CR=1 FL=1
MSLCFKINMHDTEPVKVFCKIRINLVNSTFKILQEALNNFICPNFKFNRLNIRVTLSSMIYF